MARIRTPGLPGWLARVRRTRSKFMPVRAPLRSRLVFLLVVGLLAMFLGARLVASTIVLGGFRAVEKQDTIEHTRRALDALRASLTALSNSTGDWANWTETYNFIETADPRFVRDNLETPTSFVQLRLDAMVFVHRSGRRVLTRVYDAEQKRYVAPSAGLLHAVAAPSPLLDHPAPDHSTAGILMLSEGPMLVASRQILTSDGTGPPRGTLIFGRYLDREAMQQLSAQVRLNVAVQGVSAADLPADFSRARVALLSGPDVFVSPQDNTLVSGYALLADVYGRPALILRVDIPRVIYSRGQVTARYFVTALTGLGFLLGLVLFFLAERLIVSQIARQEGENRHRAIVEQTSEGILLLDETGRHILEANPAVQRMLSLDGAGPQARLLDVVAPDVHGVVQELLGGQASIGGSLVREVVHRQPDASDLNLEVSSSVMRNGERLLIVCVVRDVTSRKAAERALRVSEERYALAAQGANDGLWDWDLKAQRTYFSPRWSSMLGHAEGEIGDSIDEWLGRVHRDDVGNVTQELLRHINGESPHFECEFRIQHKDGTSRWMLARGLAVNNGEGTAYRIAGSMTDITARKHAEEQLLHDALHDSLTGLPNRVLFADRLRQALLRLKRAPRRRFGVLFVDVDRFKVVNDSLGHLAGDQLLTLIAQRLEGSLRPGDTVARLGGDEFGVLVEDITSAGDIESVVARIGEPMQAPHPLDGREVFVTVSIGSVFGSDAYTRPEDVLRDADTALYRAKALGRDRHIAFNPSMHERAMETLRLESDLRRAVERQELLLFFQPIVVLSTGSVCGFEALLRWQHHERGLLEPGSFIPLAEETGLIIPIGQHVLDLACAQIREWGVQFPADPPLFVSVNLSPKQFGQPRLADNIVEMLRKHDLDPRALRLEITETVVMENVDNAAAVISRLKSMGVGVAIDDFGTGYSSLGILYRLPIDTLKVDRSFLRSASLPEKEIPSVVRTILAMAKGLSLEVVAEGVETRSQVARLKALGCKYAQGFTFSEPLAASRAEMLLKVSRKAAV